jgi:hypothetical protein
MVSPFGRSWVIGPNGPWATAGALSLGNSETAPLQRTQGVLNLVPGFVSCEELLNLRFAQRALVSKRGQDSVGGVVPERLPEDPTRRRLAIVPKSKSGFEVSQAHDWGLIQQGIDAREPHDLRLRASKHGAEETRDAGGQSAVDLDPMGFSSPTPLELLDGTGEGGGCAKLGYKASACRLR